MLHPDTRARQSRRLPEHGLAEAVSLGAALPGLDILWAEVIRLPRAWSLIDIDTQDVVSQVTEWLHSIDGVVCAQGGDVMTAIAAGEHAAAAASAMCN